MSDKGKAGAHYDSHPKGNYSPQRDAAMRMYSEAAKHPVCVECGCAGGRHLKQCSRST